MELPFTPGVMTPTDIESALVAGVSVLKFFPAGAAGGVPMLSSLAAPTLSWALRFVPTGGVTLENVRDTFSLPAGAGSGEPGWPRRMISPQGAGQIVTNCRQVCELLAK